MKKKSVFGKLLLIALILGGGIFISLLLLWTGPTTEPKEKSSTAKVVQTVMIESSNRPVAISAFGTVIPSQKVVIRPQVSGQVIHQNPSVTIGGRVKSGEELIRIDPKDYELALAEVRSDLEQARFEREVESGRQVIALREWEELRSELNMEEVNRSLVLREPHLRRAEALMQKAKNDIEIAELQLSRTKINSPFNAMVAEESVEIGQLLTPNSQVCTLVGTDEFWIQVTVPFSELKWIKFPDNENQGASAQVILDTGNGEFTSWEGKVIRLLSDLDPLGRMARLIVSVPDPLGLNLPSPASLPLLLGSYVEVKIDAGELVDSIAIPRVALREGDLVWVAGNDNRLKVIKATRLWTLKDSYIVKNDFAEGDQIIVSDLRVAIPEMEIEPQLSTAYPEFNKIAERKGEDET